MLGAGQTDRRANRFGAISHQVEALLHVRGLSSAHRVQVRPRDVDDGVCSARVVVLEPSGHPVMHARRKLRVHIRAGQRIIEVEDQRDPADPAEQDPNESTGVGHHEHDDRVWLAVTHYATPGEDRRNQPEDRLIWPNEQLDQLLKPHAPQRPEERRRPPAGDDLDMQAIEIMSATGLGHDGDVPLLGESSEQLARVDSRRCRGGRKGLRDAEERGLPRGLGRGAHIQTGVGWERAPPRGSSRGPCSWPACQVRRAVRYASASADT